MNSRLASVALAAALGLAVVGCSSEAARGTAPAAEAAATPEGAIAASVQHLRAGNIEALVVSALPPEDYARVKADYARKMSETPPSEEEKARFAETMAKLTAPDAEAKLWAELEPKLKDMDAQMAQQMPMLVAMGKGFALNSIQQSQDLTDAQKQQAAQALDALGNWITTTKFTDPVLLQKAIKVTCETARKIDLKTLDEARALSYEQTMGKVGIGFLGLKEVLGLYGLPIDPLLDSIQVETLSSEADAAKVRIKYSLFDTPLSAESDLVKIGGRWYGKQVMESFKKKSEPAAENQG